MNIFLSGGAKNGKSDFAQELAVKLAGGGTHYYVATMIPCDEEDHIRIQKHLASREGLGFETVECGRNILSCLEKTDQNAAFLLDSVTALLMNELFPDPHSAEPDGSAGERCAKELTAFVRLVNHCVLVSDAIYTDAARYDEVTETYRCCLAEIDRALAQICDVVIEISAGQRIIHKGELPE